MREAAGVMAKQAAMGEAKGLGEEATAIPAVGTPGEARLTGGEAASRKEAGTL